MFFYLQSNNNVRTRNVNQLAEMVITVLHDLHDNVIIVYDMYNVRDVL